MALLGVASLASLTLTTCSAEVQKVGPLERIVAFVVGEEIGRNHLEHRKDVCFAIGNGLSVDQGTVFALLKNQGYSVHRDTWCVGNPRGMTISISSLDETELGTYVVVSKLGDLSPIQKGEDLATLLRRGTYKISCSDNASPNLISYEETCCAKH